MSDKLMHIPNDDNKTTPSVDYNYWLKRLDTQLNETTNQNLIKVLKVVMPTNEEKVIVKPWGLV